MRPRAAIQRMLPSAGRMRNCVSRSARVFDAMQHGPLGLGAILGMQSARPVLILTGERARGQAVESFSLGRPDHGAGFEIPFEGPDAAGLLSQIEALEAAG